MLSKPFQFGLASLFAVTLAVCLLLWAWRFGPQRLIVILAILPAAILMPIWLYLVSQKLLERLRHGPD